MQYRTYWSARDEWMLTGNREAFDAMLDMVEDLPLGAEYDDRPA